MPSFAAFGNDLYTGRRSIDFVGRRRTWYLVAAAAVVLSLLSLGVRGLNLGLEFRGGTEIRVSNSRSLDQTKAVSAVDGVVAGAEVRVSTLGDSGLRIETDALNNLASGEVQSKTDALQNAVAKAYDVPASSVSTQVVGADWGKDVSQKALTSLIVFLLAVTLVIALYFRTWKMAVAALVALVHDLLLTAGVYSLVGFEVTPASVIGFLTILGYSLYDTVVVFDKVRENTDHITGTTKRTYEEAANLAVNQTLVRSINTSVVALLPVASILFIGAFLLGAGSLKDISLALFVGIAAGTYSSIFIATPLLADLRGREPDILAQAERVRRKRAEAAAAGSGGDPDDGASLAVVAAGPSGASLTAGAAAGPRGAGSGSAGSGASGSGASGAGGTGSGASGSGAGSSTAPRSGGGQQRQQPRRGGHNRPGGRKR